MIFDKQIHKDDFRLRILVTNSCNKDCFHCLNDFQSKGDARFLDLDVARRVIQSYCLFMGDNAQVEISGGEPGIYPHLKEVVKYAKECNATVKLNTNGTALNQGIDEYVDIWHIGVTWDGSLLIDDIKRVNGQVQIVVTSNVMNYYILNAIEYYGYHNVPIKLFVDFFANGEEKKKIEEVIKNVIEWYPEFDIKTRFTGTQENRGGICEGCTRKCITLKALWLFPDGTVSPCPQKVILPEPFDEYIVKAAFYGHKLGEYNE